MEVMIRHIERDSILLLLFFLALTAYLFPQGSILLSMALGGLIMTLNFRILKVIIKGIISNPERKKATSLFKILAKSLGLLATVGLILSLDIINGLAFFFGTITLFGAIVISGFKALRFTTMDL